MGDNDGFNAPHIIRTLADVNGDGLPDAIAFAYGFVAVALSTGQSFRSYTGWISDFCEGQGWKVGEHPRFMQDMNEDGMADIVGFGEDGVWVSLSTGSSFSPASRWTRQLGNNDGFNAPHIIRTLADVNGDGLPDAIAFAYGFVAVALSTGQSFRSYTGWISNFCEGQGWKVGEHPRFMKDMNEDGMADIVGFGEDGVWVALSTGSSFSPASRWTRQLGNNDGFNAPHIIRTLADVNGDGLPDAIAFAYGFVAVALSTGQSFRSYTGWISNFCEGQGWKVGEHPRFMRDMNEDGMADIVGFGEDGVWVALSTGSSFSPAIGWTSDFAARSWSNERFVLDLNDDTYADIAGFGKDGVYCATRPNGI